MLAQLGHHDKTERSEHTKIQRMGYAGSHTTGTSSEPKRISYRRLLRISRRLCRLCLCCLAHGVLSGSHDVQGLTTIRR